MSWINAVAGAVGTALGVIGTVRDKTQDYWMLRRHKRSKLAQTLSDLRQEEARLREALRREREDR